MSRIVKRATPKPKTLNLDLVHAISSRLHSGTHIRHLYSICWFSIALDFYICVDIPMTNLLIIDFLLKRSDILAPPICNCHLVSVLHFDGAHF